MIDTHFFFLDHCLCVFDFLSTAVVDIFLIFDHPADGLDVLGLGPEPRLRIRILDEGEIWRQYILTRSGLFRVRRPTAAETGFVEPSESVRDRKVIYFFVFINQLHFYYYIYFFEKMKLLEQLFVQYS